jgi:hypothetical protein
MHHRVPAAGRTAPAQKHLEQSLWHGAAHSPTHDAAGANIEDEGHIQPPLPSGKIGEIRDPKLIGAIGFDYPIDPVQQRSRRLDVAHRGADHHAAAHALQSQASHQSFQRAACNANPFAVHLHPNFVGTVEPLIRLPDTLNVREQDVD